VFINTFINALFTNPELKTVYNGPGNYKQRPKFDGLKLIDGEELTAF
jgi:hypothetical protein